MSSCGCVGHFFTAPRYVNLTETPFCMDVSADSDTFNERGHCMLRKSEEAGYPCSLACQPACKQYRYPSRAFSAKWPKKSQQLPFYHRFIKGTKLESKFAVFEQISNLSKNGQMEDVARLLQETTLMEENFLQVSVYLSSIDVAVLSDHASITVVDLFSSIGGTLNLYSGISCVVVIEIIDFVYKVCFTSGKDNKKLQSTKERHSSAASTLPPTFANNYDFRRQEAST